YLGVEDLIADSARLIQDDAAKLGIRVELEVLALVEEAPPPIVDEHAVGIREAIGLVGELAVAVGRRVGVDGRGVAARPLAEGKGPDLHRHAQPVAGVVAGAAHLGVVPGPAEIACPPGVVGLEAAAAQHHRARGDVLEAPRALRAHAGDAAAAVLEEADGAGRVANLDTGALSDLEPGAREP